ncbi:RNA polymerase II-associated protein 3 [Sitodiplosis mosellana]|uniref:RNA polymerase II-associated protein 3 n=1 Tax=Sitodiplosis mosellana TaxID=263140 RepID=UPI00244431E5|nr:RNA polymerase II-associated protein 3 [Sitodiplosis mosellana]
MKREGKMSDLETQAKIMHKSNQIRDAVHGLYEWEKDIKQMEAKRNVVPDEEAFDHSYPLRNQIQPPKPSISAQSAKPSTSTAPDKPAESSKTGATIPMAVENANEFKIRGNNCVKAGEYQKAVHYYTEAIRLNKSEAVYYTNRALCYLKQNKFNECIADCTTAVGLDGKAVKAYYRRMQAREQMKSDLEAALSDCKTVLRIDPKNVDAQKSLDRLERLLKASGKKITKRDLEVKAAAATPVAWSQFEGKNGYDRIDFVTKAPHLRSKQALKRMAIGDNGEKATPTPMAIDSNRAEETKPLLSNIDQTAESKTMTVTSNAMADLSKTSTDLGKTVAKATKPILVESKPHVIPVELATPKNSAQFHKTWMSIKNADQKFTVLKGIYKADIGRMLGAQFNLTVLREIFTILKSHFINQNLPIANILSGMMNNEQMTIISAMMNAEDKLAFTKLVEYMRIRGEDTDKIDAIQKTFDDLISM